MKMNKALLVWSALFILFSLAFSACAPTASPTPAPETSNLPSEPVTLKIAVIPIMDTLPMYVAQKEGMFEARNVKVEFIPVGSAAERDQVISAGQADGMINEVVSTMFYNRETIQVQIVRFARVATEKSPLFYIIASQQSGITDPAGLKGVEIGISQGTVIEYLTDRLLESEGFTAADIKSIAVPKIPDRMTLLSSGELKAAMLPDPFSFLAVQQGGVIVMDDAKFPQYGYSTIAFRKAVIDAHPEAVKAFLAAIEEATAMINADPTPYNSLLTEQKLVPAPLVGTYAIGPYPVAGVPSQEQWNDVLNWAKSKGMLNVDVSYADSVNATLLP